MSANTNCQLPLISVIVPVYNVEKYLQKCIDSIVAQTYSNLEIILVNDGSTDNSPQICDMYAERNSCINAIHTHNQGVGFARNTGIDISTYYYQRESSVAHNMFGNRCIDDLKAALSTVQLLLDKGLLEAARNCYTGAVIRVAIMDNKKVGRKLLYSTYSKNEVRIFRNKGLLFYIA